MDQSGFRILGLVTSYSKTDETRDLVEARKPKYCPRPLPKLSKAFSKQVVPTESNVTVRLADVLPLLIEASQKNRAWVEDFGDDPVTLSQDLYEVALAYGSMRRAA